MGVCDDFTAMAEGDDGGDSDGFIDWGDLYCSVSSKYDWSIFLFSIFVALVMFQSLGSTADNYFVPVLHLISYICKLRPDVAGVTLMAFGNAAPDVITAITGLADANDFGIVIGNLLGGSTFILMVILGAVLRTAENQDEEGLGYIQLDKSTIVRDLVSYTLSIMLIMVFAATGSLQVWQALLLLGLYSIYVYYVMRNGQSTTGDILGDHLKHRAIAVTTDHHVSRSRLNSESSFNTAPSLGKQRVDAYKHILTKERAVGAGGRFNSTGTMSTAASIMSSLKIDGVEGDNASIANSSLASNTSQAKPGLVDLMQQSGDATEDLGDSLPGVDFPEDPCPCCCSVGAAPVDDIEDNAGDDGSTNSTAGPFTWYKVQADLTFVWICYVVELPFSIARTLSMPCVDQGWGWRRRICDTLCWPGGFFAIVVGFVDWDDVSFEAWIVIMSFGFAIGFLFYLSTEDGPKEPYSLLNDHGGMDDDLIEKGGPAKSEDAGAAGPNKASPMLVGSPDGTKRSWWFWPIMLLTFFSSIAWMNVIAGESVNAALSVATVSRLSSSIIGLTMVAWGNSVGDLVADVAVAKSGAVFTAICSTVGSPMLSAVLGICLSITIALADEPDMFAAKIPVALDAVSWVSYSFLLFVQLLLIAAVHYYEFRLPLKFYRVLWAIYVVFLVTVISVELNT